MAEKDYQTAILQIRNADPRYDIRAYHFMNDALNFTVEKLAKGKRQPGSRHVTGAELILGILEYAISVYGVFAPDVFRFWNIYRGADAGNIVYNMIEAKIMSASENDRKEDFDIEDDLPAALESMLEKMRPPVEPHDFSPID